MNERVSLPAYYSESMHFVLQLDSEIREGDYLQIEPDSQKFAAAELIMLVEIVMNAISIGTVHAFVLLLLFLDGLIVLMALRKKPRSSVIQKVEGCNRSSVIQKVEGCNRSCYETETIKYQGLVVVFSGRFSKSVASDPIPADGQ